MTWSDFFLLCFASGSIWAFAAVLLGSVHIGHFGHAHHVGHAPQIGHAPHSVQTNAGHTHSATAKLQSPQHGVWGHLVNPSCIAIFLAWFGAVGYLLLRHTHIVFWMDLSIAAAVGLIGALILARFLALLQGRERVLHPVDYEMVGTLGQLASAIRPTGVGEMLYVRDGARRAVPARSEDGVAIERGSEVIVLRYEKGIAYVRSWDAMAQ